MATLEAVLLDITITKIKTDFVVSHYTIAAIAAIVDGHLFRMGHLQQFNKHSLSYYVHEVSSAQVSYHSAYYAIDFIPWPAGFSQNS